MTPHDNSCVCKIEFFMVVFKDKLHSSVIKIVYDFFLFLENLNNIDYHFSDLCKSLSFHSIAIAFIFIDYHNRK